MKNIFIGKIMLLLLFIFFTSNEKLYAQQTENVSPISLEEEGVFAPFSINSIIFAKMELKSFLNNYYFFHKDDLQKVHYSTTFNMSFGGVLDSNAGFQANTAFQMLIPINKYIVIPLFNMSSLTPYAGVRDSYLYNIASVNNFVGVGSIFTHDTIGRIGLLGGYYIGRTQTTIINSSLYDELNDIGITHFDHGNIVNSGAVITFLPNISFSKIPFFGLFLRNFDNLLEFNMAGVDLNDFKLERSHKLNSKNIPLNNDFQIDFINIFNSDEKYDFYTRAHTTGLGVAFSTDGYEMSRVMLNLNFGYRNFYNILEVAVEQVYQDTFFGQIILSLGLTTELIGGYCGEFSKNNIKAGIFVRDHEFSGEVFFTFNTSTSGMNGSLLFRWYK